MILSLSLSLSHINARIIQAISFSQSIQKQQNIFPSHFKTDIFLSLTLPPHLHLLAYIQFKVHENIMNCSLKNGMIILTIEACVVYFDQISGAARTWNVVEILFGPFSDIYNFFTMLCPGPVRCLCFLWIFINKLMYFNVTCQ